MKRIGLLASLSVLMFLGCGGDNGDPNTSGDGARTVVIEDYLYEPARIVVPQGTTVAFTNRDSTPHTATSKASGQFESGSLDTGETGTVRLEESGSFAYYCLFHPFMKGALIVE